MISRVQLRKTVNFEKHRAKVDDHDWNSIEDKLYMFLLGLFIPGQRLLHIFIIVLETLLTFCSKSSSVDYLC